MVPSQKPFCSASLPARRSYRTTTPAGKAMFQMMGVFSEFERAMIQERVRAGLARAKDEGKTLGRPRIDGTVESAIRKTLMKGDMGMHKIAAKLGVATGTVQRVKAAMGSL
jgi:DNA invertase Pin-like site-specific DNA recombinase